MVTVMHCKFLRLSEHKKKTDNTKFFKLTVLEETEKNVHTLDFFVDNQTALNLKDIQYMQNVGVSFDIFFGDNNAMKYKIKSIVIEK